MDRIDRRRFLALASLLSLSGLSVGSLSGCGGGSNGGGTSRPVDTRGTVAFPAGFILPLAELTALTGLTVPGGGALTSALGFTVRTTATSWTLSWVQHASERLVLLGFVDPTRTDNVIDSASTAVAMLYLALGGFRIPEENKVTLIGLLQSDPETAILAGVIAERIAANPFAVAEGDVAVITALKTAQDRILAGTRAVGTSSSLDSKTRSRQANVPSLTLIQPSGEHSGVEVLQGDQAQTIFATNHYRRHCQMRVYEVGTQDGDNLPSYYNTARAVGQAISLPSTGALGILSTVGALAIGGSTAFVPVSTPPVTLTPNGNVSKTLFEVIVLGSAFTLQEPAFFSDTRYSNEVELWRSVRLSQNLLSWVADILFGVLLELWGIRDIIKSEAAVQAAAQATIQALKEIELQSIRDLVIRAGKGEMLEVLPKMMEHAAQSTIVGEKIFEALKPLVAVAAEQISKEQAAILIKAPLRFVNALNIAGVIVGAGDLGAVVHDLASANAADLWNVTLFKPTLKLSPQESDIAKGARVSYRASIEGVTGNMVFVWTTDTAFGTLSDNEGHVGTSFENTSGMVDLQTTPSDQADILVMVKGYMVGQDGSRTFAGEAIAKVTINDKKTLVFGRYQTEQFSYESSGNARHLTLAFVVVPQVENAVEYIVNCYGFNDTLHYGTRYGRTWAAPVTYLPIKPAGTTNGNYPQDSRTDKEIWDSISSYSGPASGAGEAVSSMNGRFAGMIVEVIATIR